MALVIVWSPKALKNFNELIDYLQENWSDIVVKEFVARTEQVLKLIADNPEVFRRVSNQNSIREALITKHNLLLYRFSTTNVELLAVFDTRQHPRKKIIK